MRSPERLAYGSTRVDLVRGTVTRDSRVQALAPREVEVLRYLADRLGVLVGRDELEREVWGFRAAVRSEAVPVCMRRLRQKLEADDPESHILLTVRSKGWTLVPPSRAPELDEAPAGLVGRRAELGWIEAALQRDVRTLTVLGPAGVGKSRLVREVMRRSPKDVVFVELHAAAVDRDVDLLVARSLGVTLDGSAPDGLAYALRARGPVVLLVLDECEVFLRVVSERVSAWSAACPGLTVIATSRIPLGVAGEQQIPLGPLGDDDASTLFVERVQQVHPGFVCAPEQVAEVIRQVDGLPLAIELAAARAHLLGFESLLAHLRRPLDVLAGAGRQGMAEVLERSFELLPGPDREVLVGLAVLHAEFTLDDAGGVLALGPSGAISVIETLVRHALIRVVAGEPTRYVLYAMVRDRARRELTLTHPAHAAHQRWFARLGDPEWLEGVNGDPAARRMLRAAGADLRVAIRFGSEPELTARCGLALISLLNREGLASDVVELAEQLRDLSCPDDLRTEIGLNAIESLLQLGRMAEAIAHSEELLELPQTSTREAQIRRIRMGIVYGMDNSPQARLSFVGAELEHIASLPDVREDVGHSLVVFQIRYPVLLSAEEMSRRLRPALNATARYRDPMVEGNTCAGVALAFELLGCWSEASRWVDRGLAAVAAAGEFGTVARALLLHRGMACARRQGGVDEAVGRHAAMTDLLPRVGPFVTENIALERALLSGIEDPEAGATVLEAFIAQASPALGRIAREALAELALDRGAASAARAVLSDGFPAGTEEQSPVRFALLALLAAGEGDFHEAEASLVRAERILVRPPGRIHWLCARATVSALAGRPDAGAFLREAYALAAPMALLPPARLSRSLERAARVVENRRRRVRVR